MSVNHLKSLDESQFDGPNHPGALHIGAGRVKPRWRPIQNNVGVLVKKFDADKIADIVAKRLGRDFSKIEIHDVKVEQDVDHDGEEVLRIQVIFKGELRKIDARQLASVARRIRPLLNKEVDTELYPLLSFVSKVDYDRGHGKRESR